MRTKSALKVHTGEPCMKTGTWRTECPGDIMQFIKGVQMPPCNDKAVIWIFCN